MSLSCAWIMVFLQFTNSSANLPYLVVSVYDRDMAHNFLKKSEPGAIRMFKEFDCVCVALLVFPVVINQCMSWHLWFLLCFLH